MDEGAQSCGFLQEVQLRFLCPDDVPVLKVLCAEWFPIPYPDTWYNDITSNQRFYSVAATIRGQIIGMIVSEVKPRTRCNKEDGDILSSSFGPTTEVVYILSLGVIKYYRRMGIASLLMDNLLSYLTTQRLNVKVVYLHVLSTNKSAIGFYERQRFRLHNFLPYYYAIDGRARDGCCYVLYINGGKPPWTILDALRGLATFLWSWKPKNFLRRLGSRLKQCWRVSGLPRPSPTTSMAVTSAL